MRICAYCYDGFMSISKKKHEFGVRVNIGEKFKTELDFNNSINMRVHPFFENMQNWFVRTDCIFSVHSSKTPSEINLTLNSISLN